MDWKREISIAHLVKQKVAEVDAVGLWAHPFPNVAANEAEVIGLEENLGFSLDENMRQFLLHANGWKSFFQSIDIFGCEDFITGDIHNRSEKILSSLENLKELCGFDASDLIPFAVSSDDIDVFVISKSTSSTPGKVFWFAGGLVDQFPDFNEWFLSMVDYNRRQFQKMREQSDIL